MNELEILADLGDNADLLTKSDDWLEIERLRLSQRLGLIVRELRAILNAASLKRRLQQRNQVVVRRPEAGGFQVLPLSLAILAAREPANALNLDQLVVWAADGYDVETAC
jgi:hypothetical protein